MFSLEELTLVCCSRNEGERAEGRVRNNGIQLMVTRPRCLRDRQITKKFMIVIPILSHGSDFFQVSMYSGHLVVKIQPFKTLTSMKRM